MLARILGFAELAVVPTVGLVEFEGWSQGALDFYAGLEADNSKAYWAAHKQIYEGEVKAPMLALLEALEDEFGPGRLFRPYRDTRFSPDKTPFKTAVAATVGTYGYVSLSADGLVAGSGYYHLSPGQLAQYRSAVDNERSGSELEAILDRVRELGNEVVGVAPLKTAPRGYPKDHPRVGLLRNKGLVAMRAWEPTRWLATSSAKDRVAVCLRTSAPLVGWLADHVGEEENRRP